MELSKEIQELNDLLRPRWVSGLWNVDHAERPSDPKTRVKPHLWKWHDIYDSLVQAKEKISVASGSVERRVIRLVNPGMADSEMTSHTILLSFQLIQPGEVAPAHRHTMSAFRFILQGHGAYTNVDGQKMVMEDGDLILTPQGCWHEHAHEGDENMVWIDGLDVPFVQALQQISFDPYKPGRLPVVETIDPAMFSRHDPTDRRRHAGNARCCTITGATRILRCNAWRAHRETPSTEPRWNSSIPRPAARHCRRCHAECKCCARTKKPNRTATPARASTTPSAAAARRSSMARNFIGRKATRSSCRSGPGTSTPTRHQRTKRFYSRCTTSRS